MAHGEVRSSMSFIARRCYGSGLCQYRGNGTTSLLGPLRREGSARRSLHRWRHHIEAGRAARLVLLHALRVLHFPVDAVVIDALGLQRADPHVDTLLRSGDLLQWVDRAGA